MNKEIVNTMSFMKNICFFHIQLYQGYKKNTGTAEKIKTAYIWNQIFAKRQEEYQEYFEDIDSA